MPRKPSSHSRAPKVTPRELKLERDAKRLRAEIATLRNSKEASGGSERVGLSPESRLELCRKIGRMFRNCVLHLIPADERCTVCGGMTEAQIQAAWERWEYQEEECVARAEAWRANRASG